MYLLTRYKPLPISRIIIVFTPQDLTAKVVRKAFNMARQIGKSVLGVIENRSYLYIPEVDREIELFGKSRGEKISLAAGASLLGQVLLDHQLARLCDDGKIEAYDAEIIASLGKSLVLVTSAKVSSEKK